MLVVFNVGELLWLVGTFNALSSRAEAAYLLLAAAIAVFAAKLHYHLHQLMFLFIYF